MRGTLIRQQVHYHVGKVWARKVKAKREGEVKAKSKLYRIKDAARQGCFCVLYTNFGKCILLITKWYKFESKNYYKYYNAKSMQRVHTKMSSLERVYARMLSPTSLFSLHSGICYCLYPLHICICQLKTTFLLLSTKQ